MWPDVVTGTFKKNGMYSITSACRMGEPAKAAAVVVMFREGTDQSAARLSVLHRPKLHDEGGYVKGEVLVQRNHTSVPIPTAVSVGPAQSGYGVSRAPLPIPPAVMMMERTRGWARHSKIFTAPCARWPEIRIAASIPPACFQRSPTRGRIELDARASRRLGNRGQAGPPPNG